MSNDMAPADMTLISALIAPRQPGRKQCFLVSLVLDSSLFVANILPAYGSFQNHVLPLKAFWPGDLLKTVEAFLPIIEANSIEHSLYFFVCSSFQHSMSAWKNAIRLSGAGLIHAWFPSKGHNERHGGGSISIRHKRKYLLFLYLAQSNSLSDRRQEISELN